MPRLSRLERPVIVGHIEPGHDCYAPRIALVNAISKGDARRWWKFKGQVTTVEHGYQSYAKTPDAFRDHYDPREPENTGKLLQLVDEARANEVPFPTTYADVFHKHFYTPRVGRSENQLFAAQFAGGWEQALRLGPQLGTWRLYDIRSAYLAAALSGLPDPATFSFAGDVCHRRDGLYRVRLEYTVQDAPYPFNTHRDVNATAYEIQLYGLPVREVLGGLTWTRELPSQRIEDAIRRVSYWKQAARSFWGRWAMHDTVDCCTPGNAWELPPMGQNQVWAHLVVGRVREKVFHVAGPRAAHVFVDSVLTSDTITTGNGIGDWVLQKTYDRGVYIQGAGSYGALDSDVLDKAAGVPKGTAPRKRRVRFDPRYGNVELSVMDEVDATARTA